MKSCRVCFLEKSLSSFPKNKNFKDGHNTICKLCKKEVDKKYRLKTLSNPEKMAKEKERTRNWHRLKSAGFTSELFEQRLKEQNQKCAICGTKDPGSTNWHADHCHNTMTPRGVLCKKCNTGIGMLKDDPVIVEKALNYLKYYSPDR